MDRIDLFRIFIRVVECASFTKAADSLALPRSTVSAAIQELEKRVGARLLHRTTRKVAATQDGLAFYDRCQRLISDVEETEGLFRQSSALPAGKLRVDVPGRIGRLIIAPALPEFLSQYPDIYIELGVTDRSVDFIDERIDCALRVGELPDSTLIARPIGKLPIINVASISYLAEYGIPRSPNDLSQHWAINYASPSTARIEDWEWLEDGLLHTTRVRSRITVNNAEAYIACCTAGLGLIQIPAYDVADKIAAGTLREVMPKHRSPDLPITLLYPHREHLSRRLHVFADWLEKLIRRDVLTDRKRRRSHN